MRYIFLLLITASLYGKTFTLTINRYPGDISAYLIDQKGKKFDLSQHKIALEQGRYWLFFQREGYLTPERQQVGNDEIYLYYNQTYNILMIPDYFRFGSVEAGYEFTDLTPTITLKPFLWQTATYSRIEAGYQYQPEQHRFFIGAPLIINPENRLTFILPSSYLLLPGALNLNYQKGWNWSVSWPLGIQLNFLDHFAIKSEVIFEVPIQRDFEWDYHCFISILWKGF